MGIRLLATFLLSPTLATPASAAPVKNGFDLAGALVPASAILPGGPPRDGIPAIDRPSFLPARAADDLKPEDRVLGVRLNGQAKAYPVTILNWHEIVNDRFGDTPVAVTYCPLCGTGLGYRCNQSCVHCHVNAGPGRKEQMDDATIAVADHCYGCAAGQGSSCGGALAAGDRGHVGSAGAVPGENITPTERAA